MVGLAVEWMRQPTGEIYNMDTETVLGTLVVPIYSCSILVVPKVGLFRYFVAFVCRNGICLT